MLKLCSFLAFFNLILGTWLYAEGKITTYFSNDSVNGVKISDAYETHNMGVVYEYTNIIMQLDLGIVSPDMHVYKNQFRVANRSFGEIVRFSLGKKMSLPEKFSGKYYFNVASAGSFNIDKMQDFMHKLLTLQPVNNVNDLVRMPDQTWVGLGLEYNFQLSKENYFFDTAGIITYLGTDAVYVQPSLTKRKAFDLFDFKSEVGSKIVLNDKIVSAPPIEAEYRAFIPYFEVGLEFDYFGKHWFIKDRFSLPSISSDDQLYGVLTAGLTFDIK